MENASKALLIAGGMLLIILVLTFAMFLFNRMANSASRQYEELNEHYIAEFNQKFFNYENKPEIDAHDVVSIINLAKDCNKSEKYPAHVKVTFNGETNYQDKTDSEIISLLSNENKYKCTLKFSNTSTYVEEINITN